MSIHGNQKILPMFLREDRNLLPINDTEELSIAFYLLTHDIGEDEKIISFSRLLWPFLYVPGIISTHIILDGLKLFNKKGKLTNPPRQPLIGHLLRNVENLTEIEQLNKIIDILEYNDIDTESIGKNDDTEFKKLKIKNIINPEFIQALLTLIPDVKNKPVGDYMPLDSGLSTDDALKISEEYRATIESMKGNSLRWKTQTELIGNEFAKKLIDLNVRIKDINHYYFSQINKTSSTIDNFQIKEATNMKGDTMEQWKTAEKKKVRENITLLFRNIGSQLDNIMKKNRFYSTDDSLKKKSIEEILPSFGSHFNFLKSEAVNFVELINDYYKKFEELIGKIPQIDKMAVENMYDYEQTLNVKLQDRDKLLSQYKKEEEIKISEIESLKNQVESSLVKIKDIIQNKSGSCMKESEDLKTWAIDDNKSELFSIPIQWIYMPFYAMFIEDEDMMEERLNVVFPGYIQEKELYKPISDAFISLKDIINDKIDDDMHIRSNFEFSCEKKNFLDDPNTNNLIHKGVRSLLDKTLLTREIEEIISKNLKLLS